MKEQKLPPFDLLELYKPVLEIEGFYKEEFKTRIIHALESTYVRHILRDWYIADIVPSGDKFLVKWCKRFKPLTDEELEEKY